MTSLGKFNKIRVLTDSSQSSRGTSVSVGILTVSDRCARGEKEDFSGPNLQKIVRSYTGFQSLIKATKIVPDEQDLIEKTLIQWCDSLDLQLILTTGGTGLGPRDVTPEATAAIVDREAPGFSIAIITESLKVTKDAMVTRLKSGIRGKSIIINLPGSKKASEECAKVVFPAIPHAIECLKDEQRICDCTIDDGLDEAALIKTRLIEGVVGEINEFRRKLANSTPSQRPGATQDSNAAPIHHVVPGQNITEELTEDDINLDDIELESLLSTNPLGGDGIGSGAGKEFPAISVDEAFDTALDKTEVLGTEKIRGADAFGRTLAEDVTTSNNQGSPNIIAKVNGYAVAGSVVQGEVRVINIRSENISRRQAGQVAAGAALPSSTDTVIAIEDTDLIGGNKIRITKNVPAGKGTQKSSLKGSSGGDVVLAKGSKLGPTDIGKLTSAGINIFQTYKDPVVAVISIGDQSISASHITLQVSLRQHSIIPKDLGIVECDSDKLSSALISSLKTYDMVICSGGTKKARDLSRSVIEKKLKATTHFGNVNMKPWKQSYFATTTYREKQKIFFVVPECPTANILCTIFMIPVLRKMSGMDDPGHTILKAQVQSDQILSKLQEYVQCQVSWVPGETLPRAEISTVEADDRFSTTSDAKALLVLPPSTKQAPALKKGDACDILLITRI